MSIKKAEPKRMFVPKSQRVDPVTDLRGDPAPPPAAPAPMAEAKKMGRPASVERVDPKRVTFTFDRATHKKFQRYALDHDLTLQSIVEDFVKDLVKDVT